MSEKRKRRGKGDEAGTINRNRPLQGILWPRQLTQEESLDHDLLNLFYGGSLSPKVGEPSGMSWAREAREKDLFNFDLVQDRLREFLRERPEWLEQEEMGERANYNGYFYGIKGSLESIAYGLEHMPDAPPLMHDLLVEVLRLGVRIGAINGRYAEHRLCAIKSTSFTFGSRENENHQKMLAWLSKKIEGIPTKINKAGSFTLTPSNKSIVNDLEREARDYRRGVIGCGLWERNGNDHSAQERCRDWLRRYLPEVIKGNVEELKNPVAP